MGSWRSARQGDEQSGVVAAGGAVLRGDARKVSDVLGEHGGRSTRSPSLARHRPLLLRSTTGGLERRSVFADRVQQRSQDGRLRAVAVHVDGTSFALGCAGHCHLMATACGGEPIAPLRFSGTDTIRKTYSPSASQSAASASSFQYSPSGIPSSGMCL